MKFLIDENLPPQLADRLRAKGEDATHVNAAGLRGAPDGQILQAAEALGAVLVTRDADFDATANAGRVRVVRLNFGNCMNASLFDLLDARWTAILARCASGAVLVLVE